MEESNANSANEIRLDWHSAFFAALQAELIDYLDVLEFHQEYPLNEQPLRIDAMVIKTPPGMVIKKNIAEVFRGHNIIEYKNPKESLSVSNYIKTIGYACLYQAVESVDYKDITVTLVCTKHPESLLSDLCNDTYCRFRVLEKHPGIFEVEGERFPVQIIESKLLPHEENAWLSSLKENTDRATLERALEMDSSVKEKVNLSAFWYVVANANVDMISEVVKMSYAQVESKWEKLFDEIGFTQKCMDKGMDITLAVVKGLKNNIPPAQISEDMGVPIERVERIKQEIYG
ncbi:MAG: hypothetical protein FWB96_09050 [Defluviitaleaceae bacterium]|nr:hypothetical protein [Defluviitaleaceae bacterium]MCL2263250.1 hypothetical protein [Defluviitaleaceae bacterium]